MPTPIVGLRLLARRFDCCWWGILLILLVVKRNGDESACRGPGGRSSWEWRGRREQERRRGNRKRRQRLCCHRARRRIVGLCVCKLVTGHPRGAHPLGILDAASGRSIAERARSALGLVLHDPVPVRSQLERLLGVLFEIGGYPGIVWLGWQARGRRLRRWALASPWRILTRLEPRHRRLG